MDIFKHLLPEDCQVPQLPLLPYTGSLEDDGGTFKDYPARLSFAMSSPGELEPETGDRYSEHTALLQTWLYFGLITTMSKQIGLEVTLSNLISKQEPNSMVVNCLAVETFLCRWRLHLDKVLTRENWRAHAEEFSQILSISLRNARLHDFDASNDSDLSTSELRAVVVLSIKALVRAFYRILLQLRSFRYKKVVYRLHFVNSDYFSLLVEPVRLLYDGVPKQSPLSVTVARRFLEDHGWSPTHIQHLLLNEDIETLYMAAALRGASRTGVQHNKCDEHRGCIAASIHNSPHHVEHGCTCAVVSPDMAIVNSIIEEGNISVIEITRTEGLQWSLKMKSVEAQTDYTAISHVWTDGFADPNTNGLLSCQLSRIVQDVQLIKKERPVLPGRFPTDRSRPVYAEAIRSGSDGPVTIWMDALCIPCKDPKAAETSSTLKRRAISLMSPTYAGASEVLVLDKTIEDKDYTIRSGVEKAYSLYHRVRFTPWMWRSWTLQEGALAKRLYVRTAKFPEHVDHLRLPLKPRVWEQRFFTSIDRLSRRDTSQKDDVYQILANLCFFDSSELESVAPQLRFQALLRTQSPEFPFGLFLRKNHSKKHSLNEDWWIPTCEDRVHLPIQDQQLTPRPAPLAKPRASMVPNAGGALPRESHQSRKGCIQRFLLQRFLRHLSKWTDPHHMDNLILLITDRLQHEIPASGIGRLEHPEYEMEQQSPLPNPEPRRLAALEKAVLHDQGVLFDANALDYTVVATEGRPLQNFRISVLGNTYWVSLDRDLSLINGSTHIDARSLLADKNQIILLPKLQEKLDAEGTIGRGLSLTQLGETQSLPIPPTLTPFTEATVWQATPSRFNSAFTCGVITKLTPKPYTDAPLLRSVLVPASSVARSSPASTFLIRINTTSWPVLQNVRTEPSLEPNREYVAGLGLVTLLLVAIAASYLSVPSFHFSASSETALLAVLASVAWLWSITLNNLLGSALQRRIRHRRWARTFHPTTPEVRARYASWGFRCRMQVVDLLYLGFLLDPIIQVGGYLARSAKRLEEKVGRHRRQG